MRLFVIGNGFDLAHNIKSKYWHFGKYLKNNYPKFYCNLMAAINNDQGIWSDFEAKLPECGTEMQENGLCIAQQRLDELDYDPMSDEEMEIWMNEQLFFISSLPDVLRTWIQSVDIKKEAAYKDGVFTNDDLYLTFNYTNTLEKIYNIDKNNILHIHGDVDEPYQELIIGHGDEKQIRWVVGSLEKSEREFADCAIAVYRSVLEFLKKTYKDTKSIIEKNDEFFMTLEDVEEIIVIGSSLSRVDKPYFIEINGSCKAIWTFVYYVSDNEFDNHVSIANTESFAESIGLKKEDYRVIPCTDILT